MSIEVTRLQDGSVHVQNGRWSDTFEEARRIPWAKWYQKMADDYGRASYAEMAKALRDLPPDQHAD